MQGDGDTISMQIRSPKVMKKDPGIDHGIDNNELHRVISAKYVTPKDKIIESSIFEKSSSKVKFDNINRSEARNTSYKSMERFLSKDEEEEQKKVAKVRLASLESARRVRAYKRKQKREEKALNTRKRRSADYGPIKKDVMIY